MWDQRYAADEYAYGRLPNEFLAAQVDRIPHGPVLDLGSGEGRNAVFLAERGYDVTAVDQSSAGLSKANRLAAERSVAITTLQRDLSDFALPTNAWSGIVSIFCHLPPAVRQPLYQSIASSLKPGGILILEAYTPAQLGRGTGGPADPQWMMSQARVQTEIAGLEWILAQEIERDVREGLFHTGLASVLQVIGRRRA